MHAAPIDAVNHFAGFAGSERRATARVPHRVHHIVKLGFIVRVSMYPAFMMVYGLHLSSRPPISRWLLAFFVLQPFVWPHVARAIARRSANSRQAEFRNLMFDSFLIGCYVPMTGFSLFPSAAGILSATVGNGGVGGGKLALKGLAMMLFGVLVFSALGFNAVDIRGASLLTECLCLGALLIYVFVIGLNSYDQSKRFARANRKMSEQNVLFEQRGVMLQEHARALEVALGEAEAANAAKGRFLANMSHELRTPLNAVIGFANIVQRNRGGRLQQTELSYLTRIVANGAHLLSLINGILDLSKIDAGEMPLDIVPVDVAELIRDTLSEVESLAAANRVVLVADVPAAAMLPADRARLKQVLFNLIGNAVKFTLDGTVTIELSVDARTGIATRIDVIDTGVGIAPERLESVFEAFQQEDTTTARKFGGTGLGLTITRSLVEHMGWRIAASSIPGHGSTFSVITSETPGTTTGTVRVVKSSCAASGATPAKAALAAVGSF